MNTVFHRLGPYEVISEIGRGGMALVVLATDTRTGRNVALKLVQRATTGEAREIFEAEQSGAELQRQFSLVSKHVPAVYEHLPNESGYFLVAMEYLDGENLSDLISRGPVQIDRAVIIASELCSFLESAHHFEAEIGGRKLRSLVHGDLKPQNVRLTSTGAVKVLDFGIAKALSLSRKVTRNDFGTRPYLSPERLDGEVNEFADLWAVGVMLYEMIRGERPFEAPDTQRLERLILSRRPPRPLTGYCPTGLEAIIAKLLGPYPDVRYENARAIREDLELLSLGTRTNAEEQGWPARAHDLEATRRTQPEKVDEEATRRTRPFVPPPLPTERTVPPSSARAPVVPPPIPGTPAAVKKGRASGAAATARPAAMPPLVKPRRRGDRVAARIMLVVFILVGFGLFMNELSVASEAKRVAADISTRGMDELDEVFRAYDRLSDDSHLRFGTIGLERALTQRTLALADRVIGNYRMALPTVREPQWQSAREGLARALRIAPDDRRLRASFRYVDGHLHRINGEAHKRRNEDDEAERELTEAIASFREAAELRTNWPDPFLGLARTFIYGLEDIDRGADALNEAQRRGYTPTPRETLQLADGYRARGASLVRSANELTGLSQESDYLTRAIEAYQRALTLYAQAAGAANVPSYIRTTQRALDQTQLRLNAIAAVAPAQPSEPESADSAPAEPTKPETPPSEEPESHEVTE